LTVASFYAIVALRVRLLA